MTAALLPRGSRFGELRLTGFVGSGGFSDVYEGFDAAGRRLAVKVLRLTGLNQVEQQIRVDREKTALSRIDSSGVAKLVCFDLAGEMPWIASEFIDGPTIKESVQSQGPLTFEETMSLSRRLAEILAEIHSEGIAHRDLTANNVIFGPSGPVLVDFGSARLDLGEESTGSLLLVGTTGFVPPEALRGEPVGRAGDVFSLARIAQFCVSGDESESPRLPRILEQALDPVPKNRPTASEIASALAGFTLQKNRNQRKQIENLPRRFRPRTLVGAAVMSGVSALGLALLLIPSDGPPSTADIIGQIDSRDNSGRTNNERFSLNGMPEDWTLERIRPTDSELPENLGVIESFQVRSDKFDGGDGSVPSVFGQMMIQIRRPSDAVKDSVNILPTDIALLADSTVDYFESAYLEDGCNFVKAREPLALDQQRSIWVARASSCGSLGQREVFVGVLWDSEAEVVATWFLDSTDPKALGVFPSRVHLTNPIADANDLRDADWQTVAKTRDSAVRLGGGYSSADFSTIQYGIGAIALGPGEAVAIESQAGSDALVSLFLLEPNQNHGPLQWIPAGRWWSRQSGEIREVGNPFNSPTVLLVEAEGVWDESVLGFVFSGSQSDSEVFQLAASLGEDLESFVVKGDSNNSTFVLPTNPDSSSDSETDLIPFNLGRLQFRIETELLGASFGLDDLTYIARADDTLYDYELSFHTEQNPHFIVAYSPAFELSIGMEASDWVSYGRGAVCRDEVRWSIPTSGGRLIIRAASKCRASDVYGFFQSSSRTASTPVFRFTLGNSDSDDEIITGSFAPGSVSELRRFRSFLSDLVANSEEIVSFSPEG